MTDYLKLKDVFEMAEILENVTDDSLELQLVNDTDDKTVNVIFQFDEEGYLTGAYVEE